MILDTNAYSALSAGHPKLRNLVRTEQYIQLPLPVIGELRYGFAKGSQEEKNERALIQFLSRSRISVLIPSLTTTVHYSAIQLLCHKNGRALSNNDIWIAALSLEVHETLITFDKDFEFLGSLSKIKLQVLSN